METKGLFSCGQVAELWALSSVWHCVLSHISGLASSAPAALLAPPVRLICSLCAEHLPICPQAMERLVLSVSSPQDCQKSSVISPHRLARWAPSKLTRLGKGWHRQGLFKKRYFCCNNIILSLETLSGILTLVGVCRAAEVLKNCSYSFWAPQRGFFCLSDFLLQAPVVRVILTGDLLGV